MRQAEQGTTSRSLAIYGLLVGLYPRRYLQQHRAEMLQNFQDLEQAFASTSALWVFIGRDLVASLRSQFTRTLWGQTGMVVLVLAIVLLYAERHAVPRRHPTEACCLGYILGWFAGWFGKRWQASSIGRGLGHIKSLPMQAIVVVTVLGLVMAAAVIGLRGQSQIITWTFCYGFLLAWGAGWLGSRRQIRS